MAGVTLRVGISTAATDLVAPPLPPGTVGVRTSVTALVAPPLSLRVGFSISIPVPPPPGPPLVMVFGATGTVVGDAVFL